MSTVEDAVDADREYCGTGQKNEDLLSLKMVDDIL